MIPMNTPNFSSFYASRLYGFVESKRRKGFKYNGEVEELQRLDRYFKEQDLTPENPDIDLIYRWLEKRPKESDKTFSTRNSIYRQLYRYLESEHDFVLPIPPDSRLKFRSSGFTPYIFTHDEICRLFTAADNEETESESFKRCAPLLFCMLYGTGLRINEALSLTVNDVSLTQGTLLIRESKNDNSRIVPMSDSLTIRMVDYLDKHVYSEKEAIFQNNTQRPVRSNTAYDWFRLILWRAGIPHCGRGQGPRMHDLRHTFAVHSLQSAVENGVDSNAFLPLLSVYLGHKTLSATERYLHLTAEAFPYLQKEMDRIMNDIIPEVKSYEG